MQPLIDDVACVVVHHRSPETLHNTLLSLEASGLPRRHILIADNGGDTDLVADLEAQGFIAIETENRGYAAAANAGIARLRDLGHGLPLVVVSTHESVTHPEAIRELRDAMKSDPRIAVAGPTLWNADVEGELWSAGGILTPTLKRPSHVRTHSSETEPVDREWLDGAFTMYRTQDIEDQPLEERYFLYFEETDLHTRLLREGRRVVWVPRAHATQKSSGIPPRLLGRNLLLFQARFFSLWRGRVGVVYEIGRLFAKKVLTGRGDWSAPWAIVDGWMDGERVFRGRLPRVPLPSDRVSI